MFRSVNVGNDTAEYARLYYYFSQVENLQYDIANTRYEIGYIYLNRLLNIFSSDAQILFIVTGFITAFSFARFIYKYSRLPWMSAYMFMTLQFFDLSMSGVRQILSIAILLFSYDFVINRKFVNFFLIVMLATSIHTSAIMFLVIYPLAMIKYKKNFYLISGILAITTFLGFKYLIPLIGRIFPQYINYFIREGSSYTNKATLAVYLMLTLWLVMFFVAKMAYNKKEAMNDKNLISTIHTDSQSLYSNYLYFNVHEIAVWLSVLMLFFALQATILNRFKYIYSVSMLIFYPNALAQLKNKKIRFIMIAGSCFVFIIYILIIYVFRPEWQSTYPYTFF